LACEWRPARYSHFIAKEIMEEFYRFGLRGEPGSEFDLLSFPAFVIFLSWQYG
jgi:hypothetical protein